VNLDAVQESVSDKSASSQVHTVLKFISQETLITLNSSMTDFEAELNFHEYVSRTHVSCKEHIRVGNVSDGGWDVCIAHPYHLNKPCLVYSFGIGDNWSFDDGMATKFGCTVRSFDPSIHKKDHVRSDNIYFYNIGIGSEDTDNITAEWTLRTLKTLIAMCHVEQKIINYLKLDVEYNEWAALETMLTDNILVNVKQFAIEIHTRELNDERSSAVDLHRYWDILHRLETVGFRKWYWHFNTWGFFPNRDSSRYISCCYELVYINANYL